LADKLLERILAVETLEKIFRINLFLSKASINAAEPDLKVITIYQSATKELLKYMEIVLVKLHDKYGVLDMHERFSCMRRISDVFTLLDDLHLQLRFIHGEWTAPETYTFVKDLFKSIIKKKEYVSIVLSDSYMFEEVDLSRYLEYKLNYYNIPATFEEIRPTLFLPKIEYSNPLNWSILVHEMGHCITQPLEDIFKDIEERNIHTTVEGIKMLKSWTEEVWCDLVASKLLGPSYIASYITFSLLLASSGNIEKSSSTHPAHRFRISIMKTFLEKTGMNLQLQSDITEINNITEFFDNLFEERCSFAREQENLQLLPRSQFPIDYQKFRDFLIEKIDTLTHKDIPYLELNNEKIRTLTKRLSEGILIGSCRENQTNKDLLKKVEELDKIMKSYKNTQRKDDNSLFNQLVEGVKEKPNHIGEIINTGWKYKCEQFYPLMMQLLFIEDNDINYCYEIFQTEITSLDDKLKKSIEISYIHNLFSEA